eukprot:3237682-Pleurochrysis_carterae.AAC.4
MRERKGNTAQPCADAIGTFGNAALIPGAFHSIRPVTRMYVLRAGVRRMINVWDMAGKYGEIKSKTGINMK